MKRSFFALTGALFFILAACQVQPEPQKAKYVFLFIGDGMGLAQVIAAEAYQSAMGHGEHETLNFRKFPHAGLSTTYAANRFITGSAAAGTALATGHKTAIGRISMDTSGTVPFESLAEKAIAAGMRAGVISSVSIDHATPAAFYAHQPSRNMYFEIGLDLAASEIDFFGGGGFKSPEGLYYGDSVFLPDLAQDSGFTLINSKEAFRALRPSGEKVLFINPGLTQGASMHYAIDQPEDYITLAEITRKGIEYLDNENGFFMMVEGGKIDWLCHANDAASMVQEVLDFEAAVEEAIAFYRLHPDETLIVVTADHETGGLAIGNKPSQYNTNFPLLSNQHTSGENFNAVLEEWREDNAGKDGFNSLMELIGEYFGLGKEGAAIELSAAETDDLEQAYVNFNARTESEYGNYSRITIHSTEAVARHAGLGWTTMSHTGVAVPVYAIGVKGASFSGNIDNTDIPRYIMESME